MKVGAKLSGSATLVSDSEKKISLFSEKKRIKDIKESEWPKEGRKRE